MITAPGGMKDWKISEISISRFFSINSPLRRFLFFLFFCILTSQAKAVPPQWWQDVHHYDGNIDPYKYYTYTAAFFGPNALPVPELPDGRVPLKNSAEVSSDFFWGYGDQTQSLSTRLTYTIIPGTIAVSGWGVLAEHYKTTIQVRDQRASMIENPNENVLIGDFYLSTLICLTKEKHYLPDMLLEIVLKTSSSESMYGARFFDTPGYYFDLTAGKSLLFPHSFIREIRFVGMYGFLCYQLNSNRQNDAPLYGGKIKLYAKNLSLENGINGYEGWLDQGDKPLVLRSRLNMDLGCSQYFVQYQHALRDYPFRRLQVGMNVSF